MVLGSSMCFLSLRHHRNNSWLSTTGADADAFFNIISSSQARRLDDQRVALPALPGISGNAESKGNSKNTKAGIAVSYRGDHCCSEYKEDSQMLLNLIIFLTYWFINKWLWFKKAQLLLQGTRQLSGPFFTSLLQGPPTTHHCCWKHTNITKKRLFQTCLSTSKGLWTMWLPKNHTEIRFFYPRDRVSKNSKSPSTGKSNVVSLVGL